MNKINFYKINETLEYSFYQLPKELFLNPSYKEKLNSDSKILYGFLLDRLTLSYQNNWYDEKGNIYLIFTREEVQNKLNLSDKTVTKAFKQLKDCGLIYERRQGRGKPNLIYVGKIVHKEIYNYFTCRNEDKPCENSRIVKNTNQDEKQKNYNSRVVENTILESENLRAINTDNNNTDNNIYISSISEKSFPKDDTESGKVKNENIIKAINDFEDVWKNYPKKEGKSKAKEYYINWVTKGRKLKNNNYKVKKLTKEEVEKAVKNYTLEVISNNREYKYIKNGDTFFNVAILDYIDIKEPDIILNERTKRTSNNKPKNTFNKYSQRNYSKRDFNNLFANSWLK